MTSPTAGGTISRERPGRGTIRFERRLLEPIDRVWASITEPAELAEWLAPSTVDLRLGGRVVHIFDPEYDDQRVEGTILVLDPPRTLEYEWRFAGETESVLRYDLRADGEATMLTITHRMLGTGNVPGYSAGWHAYLDALEAHVQGAAPPDWATTYGTVLPAYRAMWSEN